MQYLKPKLQSIVISLFFITVLAVSICAPSNDVFAITAPNMGAKISFTFDDGYSSALLVAQTLKPYGFTGTDYIITNCVGMKADNTCMAGQTSDDPPRDYMSWEDIATLHTPGTYGWEIGSHTITHPLLSTLTGASLDDEISKSQSVLGSNGYTALSLAAPYGDYNNVTLAVAAKYYSSFRTFQDLTFG